ncbi:MAG TPA: RusA family crossover junction endodeoxyribonuclease [Rummeliibacillus sp.]|nr:RusA family crossover junction endodeoxyribonuclease [Rummeliibacillus sp.]
MVISETISFKLPFPPTVNNYWIQIGKRRILTRDAREFKNLAYVRIFEFKQTLPENFKLRLQKENLHRNLLLYPPDRRRRDGTNLEKAVDDALVCSALINDDSQIKSWSGKMCDMDIDKKGYVIVELSIL